jgi:hypothetical protein
VKRRKEIKKQRNRDITERVKRRKERKSGKERKKGL